MSVAYWSTCRPTIGQPLLVDISTNISVECWSTYWYVDRHISVDISVECRSICRPTYQSSVGWYVNRYISQLSVNMSTDIPVEGCTKNTRLWSCFVTFSASFKVWLHSVCNNFPLVFVPPLIKTITKFSNVIGYQQPDLSINWTAYASCL